MTNNQSKPAEKTLTIPEWYMNVPELIRTKVPSYFRHIDLAKLGLEIGDAKSTFSEISITVVDTTSKADQKGNRKPVRITGPPCRLKYPNLHATGDFPAVKGVTLTGAAFSVQIYEGDIPEKQCGFPNLAAEQKAFFDFCKDLWARILTLMWENPKIRKAYKEQIIENAKAYMNGTDAEIEALIKSETSQAKLKKQFFDGANRDDKAKYPFVKNDDGSNEYYPGRYMLIKKSVCAMITDPKYVLEDAPADPNHFINKLYAEKRMYTPPVIQDLKGKAYDLGDNDEPFLQTGDMCMPSFFVKAYDSNKGYGARPLYCVMQFMRKVRDGEVKTAGVDLSGLCGEEYDPFEEASAPKAAPAAGPATNPPATTDPVTTDNTNTTKTEGEAPGAGGAAVPDAGKRRRPAASTQPKKTRNTDPEAQYQAD